MPTKCGTYAGWNQHKRHGTKPCEDCDSAQAVYIREWRVRTGATKGLLIPIETLAEALNSVNAWSVLYQHLGPDMVDAIKKAPKA
jgi:hypothetical protein